MNSLERRLAVALSLSLVLSFGLLWAVGNATINALTEDFIAARLEHDAETVLAALTFVDEVPVLESDRVDGIYRRVFSGHYYTVLAAGQTLRSRSLWDEALPVRQLPPGAVDVGRLDRFAGQTLLLRTAGFEKQGHALTLLVAEDISTVSASLRRFDIAFAVATVLTLMALIALQRLVVRRGFRPLDRVTAAVGRLERGEIAELPESVPAEVRPLVAEVNRLLGVMGRRLQRSRNAVGNLAHALKAPLGVIARAAEEQPPGIVDSVARIREIIDHELQRARIAGTAAPGQRFRPQRELPVMERLLHRVYHQKPLRIEWAADPALELPFDRDDMLELLGNLLDNACKWAQSRVRCEVRPDHLVVEDDGPGCPDEELAHLTERGVRIDEGVPGHGLGLAIVKEIADSYGAEVVFDRSGLGGLRVEVRFGPVSSVGACCSSAEPSAGERPPNCSG